MTHPEESINTTPIDGIEILVNMARAGKIDPWNIDIVEVTDQYLQTLAELKSQDLKLTGKTLLYAAILLRMKSDGLSGINFLEIPNSETDFADDADFLDIGLETAPKPLSHLAAAVSSLEGLIQRRTSVKQPRNRKVTLNDLIRELKKYEELEKVRRLKETVEKADQRRMRNFADLSSEDIVELAHEEFIEDTIIALQGILERFFVHNEAISLSALETEGKIDRVSAFIAVLFLTARGEVDLVQEHFYDELYIVPSPAIDPIAIVAEDDDLELAG